MQPLTLERLLQQHDISSSASAQTSAGTSRVGRRWVVRMLAVLWGMPLLLCAVATPLLTVAGFAVDPLAGLGMMAFYGVASTMFMAVSVRGAALWVTPLAITHGLARLSGAGPEVLLTVPGIASVGLLLGTVFGLFVSTTEILRRDEPIGVGRAAWMAFGLGMVATLKGAPPEPSLELMSAAFLSVFFGALGMALRVPSSVVAWIFDAMLGRSPVAMQRRLAAAHPVFHHDLLCVPLVGADAMMASVLEAGRDAPERSKR